jgi:FtsZ-binding cell division protein ZapB
VEYLSAIVTALVTVILTLAAVIKFYLPKQNATWENHLGELLREVKEMKEADLQHHAREEAWQEEVRRTLGRIEEKLP